ncbi:Ig-like domain-containing protein [Nonomuraea typhae]|uniref:Ig-like domain-containing protein n=1 Tax=Nonomuraea typhae TaxID=2603600 RepID=A0ABW7ZCL1_9ACTN
MALVVLLPVTLTAAPAAAEPPAPTPTPAAPASTPEAADPGLKTAWEKAAASGQPVEVPARFTEKMKVWAEPDGKNLRAELYTRPVQLKNKTSGAWEPIDTRIVERDGTLQAARVKTPLTFGRQGSKRLVSAAGKDGTGGLGVARALPEPKISGNTITYPDAVAPGVDLVVSAQADGFVSQVVVRRKPDGPLTVGLPLTLPKGTRFGTTAAGLAQLQDAKGQAKAAPIVLTATDAKAESAPEQGKSAPVSARVETAGKTSQLVFTPDEAFLADPAVSYPVTITADDPWFGGGVPADAWVDNDNTGVSNSAAGYLRVGTTQTTANITRGYLKFDTDDPVLEGATVRDADLWVWNYKSGGPGGAKCGDPLGSGIVAARVTSPWSLDPGDPDELDWYNQPASTGAEGLNQAGYNYEATGTWCGKEEKLVHDVDGMARAWIEQGVPNHGVVLRARTESPAINWRQYYSSDYGGGEPYPGYRHPPALIIWYTPAPMPEDYSYIKLGHPLPDDATVEEIKAVTYRSSQPIQASDVSEAEAQAMRVEAREFSEDMGRTLVRPADVSEEEWNALNPNIPPPDEDPPSVVSTQPQDGEDDVRIEAEVEAVFSEPVTDALITVKSSSDTEVPGTTRMGQGSYRLFFKPSQLLSPDTTYTATVSGAKDSSGTVMGSAHSWSFTTAPPDTTAPQVLTTVPAADATNVPLETTVQTIFSESVSAVRLVIKDPSGAAVQGTLTGGARGWTFTPASRLAAQTRYQVEVSDAKDASGNVMTPHAWSFTTGTGTPPGLVAAYGMNEGTGGSVGDASGQNNTGAAAGTTWADGKYGKALSFDGDTSMITVADAHSLRLTSALTLSAWVKPATVADWRSVITKGLTTRDGASYALYASNGDANGNNPSGWLESGEQVRQVSGSVPLTVNAWTHVAITYDGSTARVFVNGAQAGETPFTSALDADDGALTIGGNTVWGEFFSGLIDEVRIYNRALDAIQLQADMNKPIGTVTPNTAGQQQRTDDTALLYPAQGATTTQAAAEPFPYNR